MTEVLKRQCSKSKKGYNQVKGIFFFFKSNTIYILMKHLLLTLLLPFTTAHLHIRGEGGQGAGGQRRGGDDFRRVSGSGREEVHPERHQVRHRRFCLRVKHLNQSTSVSRLCLDGWVWSAGARCLCAAKQEAVQTGGPTSPYLAKSSPCTRPTALCSACPSPLSPPRTRDALFLPRSTDPRSWYRTIHAGMFNPKQITVQNIQTGSRGKMKAEIKVAQGDNLSTHEYLRTGWSCVRVCLIVDCKLRFSPSSYLWSLW